MKGQQGRMYRERVRAGLAELGIGRHDDADDDAEQSEGRAEDFNDEDLHEQRGVLSIGQGARTARDTDAYTAKEIGQTDSHATPEEGKRGMEIGVLGSRAKVLKLALEDDGNNDTVDGHGLAENDTDQILRSDPGSLDGSTQQAGASDEDTPGGTGNGEANGETNAEIGPSYNSSSPTKHLSKILNRKKGNQILVNF